MDLQTWVIGAFVALIAISVIHFFFSALGTLLKWGITIAILVFLFGWAAVAEVPGKIWNGLQSLGDTKINNEPAKCIIIPTKTEAQKILDTARPALNTALGSAANEVTFTVIDNKDCKDKASIEIKSQSVDAVNKIKSDLEKLLPNIPLTVSPQ